MPVPWEQSKNGMHERGSVLEAAVSSMLGVAGGELIIPIMIVLLGADIRTAGSASILISIPIVVTGVAARHILTGHFRSRSMLAFLVLPMSAGSLLGAIVGGFAAAYAPTDTLRVVLAIILAVDQTCAKQYACTLRS